MSVFDEKSSFAGRKSFVPAKVFLESGRFESVRDEAAAE